jgi:hypothetical protein
MDTMLVNNVAFSLPHNLKFVLCFLLTLVVLVLVVTGYKSGRVEGLLYKFRLIIHFEFQNLQDFLRIP